MPTTPIGGILPWPSTGNWIHSNNVLDGTNTRRAMTFTVPKSGNIDRIAVGLGTVLNAQTLRIGLQTLDSSGNPTGTQYGGSAPGTGTPVSNTPLEITLATPAAATVGDQIAVVVEWNSTQGEVNIQSIGQPPGLFGSGYFLSYTGSWAKSATSRGGAEIRYDDGNWVETELAGAYLSVSSTFNSTSSPDEKGSYILVPEAMSVCGMYANVDADGAFDLVLYDVANTVLASWSWPSGVRGSNTTHIHWCRFAPIELNKSQVVRAAVKPTSATNIGFRPNDFIDAAHLGGISGGTNVYSTTRTDGGAWTENTARRWPVGLLLDGFNSGGGGGSGIPLGRILSGV